MKKAFHFSLFLLATLASLAVAYLFLDWPSAAEVAPTALVNYPQASQVQAAQISPSPEFTICTETDAQNAPAVYGNLVIWQDYRTGGMTSYDIYGYDLSTGQEFTVCTDVDNQRDPDIYGNVVVWYDNRSGIDDDIYGYDLSTGQEFTICTEARDQIRPAIYGNVVVWEDYRTNTNWDLYGYDLGIKQEFTVCTQAPGGQFLPAIYGDVVVWGDGRAPLLADRGDVYGYDLSTKQEFTICARTGSSQERPDIYGNLVVWSDNRGGDYDVFGYDLSTKQEFTVCTAANHQQSPAIYGNVVVWQDYRNDPGTWTNPDIYGYDLSTGQEFTICTAADEQFGPAIYGNVVVWQDWRNGGMFNSDIYGAWLLTDLRAYKAVDVITTTPGGVLDYTIVLSNAGSVPSLLIHLTDTVPVSTTYVPGSLWAGSGTTEAAGNEIRWRGVISASLAVTVTYRARVSSTVATGDLITNSAYMDDGYAPFWTNVVTTTVGNIEVNLPVIMKNQTQ